MTHTELADLRLGNVPEITYTPGDFSRVPDLRLRGFLVSFEREGVAKVNVWPIRVNHVQGMHCIFKSLQLSPQELRLVVDEVKRGIITPIEVRVRTESGKGSHTYFDPNDVRSLGAYVWAKKFLAGNRRLDTVLPQDAIVLAIRALGQTTLASQLRHLPGDLRTRH